MRMEVILNKEWKSSLRSNSYLNRKVKSNKDRRVEVVCLGELVLRGERADKSGVQVSAALPGQKVIFRD